MKKTIVALAVMGIGFGAGAAHAQDMVVKLGNVAPLTGTISHLGKDLENGTRLAIEEANAKGVSIGDKKVKFELLGEDDQADPRTGTTVAQRLVDAGVKGVIGHLNSGTSIPASRIYDQAGIPQVSPASTNPKLTLQGFEGVFRTIANDVQQGGSLGQFSVTKLGAKKVAIIDDRTAYGQGVAEVFAATAKSKGMEIVDQQYTTDKATDFMAILTSIKSKNPDAIFFGGMDTQGGPMLRQMEQLGLGNAKLFGGDGICTDKLIELSGGAKTLGNVVCAEGGASLAKMPGGTAWKARYDAKYPKQFQVYSPYVYDAVHVLVQAMVDAGSIDPKAYMPKLAAINYKGVTANIAFEKDGELKNPAMTLYMYKDGKKVPLN